MARFPFVTIFLALAAPLARGETPDAPGTTQPPKTAVKPKRGAAAKPGSKGSASDASKAPRDAAAGSKASKTDPETLRQVKQAKAAFMAAVASCERPGQCDGDSPADRDAASFLESADKTFVERCSACASEETCEAERQRIRDGRGRFGQLPCN